MARSVKHWCWDCRTRRAIDDYPDWPFTAPECRQLWARAVREHAAIVQRNRQPAKLEAGPHGKAGGASISHATGSVDGGPVGSDTGRPAAESNAERNERPPQPAEPIRASQAHPNHRRPDPHAYGLPITHTPRLPLIVTASSASS